MGRFNVITLNFYNTAITGHSYAPTYTVQTGDTLTSIANNLKSLILSSSTLQAVGMLAEAAGPQLIMNSTTSTATYYGATVSTGGTETVKVLSASPQPSSYTVAGTIHAGDSLTIDVVGPYYPYSHAYQPVHYTVVSTDT